MLLQEKESKPDGRNYLAMFRLTEKSLELLKKQQGLLVPSRYPIVDSVIDKIMSDDTNVKNSADLGLLLEGESSVENAITFLNDQISFSETRSRKTALERLKLNFPDLFWFILKYRELIVLNKNGASHKVDNLISLEKICKIEGFANPSQDWNQSLEVARTNSAILRITKEFTTAYPRGKK